MRRVPWLALLSACGATSSRPFEDAVGDASYEFNQCWGGEYRPREEFEYSEEAALSVCTACWVAERPPERVHCSVELERACDEVLAAGRCVCCWGRSYVDADDCVGCMLDECGTDVINDESAECVVDRCEQDRPVCSFTADCTVE